MSMPTNRECIFVIHSECDNEIIKEIKKYFERVSYYNSKDDIITEFQVDYLDSKKGGVGPDFAKLIRKKFRECHYYLILITKNSKNSNWVNQEIGYAQAKSMKRCLVMVADDLKNESFCFIHSTYDVQYFTYNRFKISEEPVEITRIDTTIAEEFGDRIPKSLVVIPPDEIRTRVQNFISLKRKRGAK